MAKRSLLLSVLAATVLIAAPLALETKAANQQTAPDVVITAPTFLVAETFTPKIELQPAAKSASMDINEAFEATISQPPTQYSWMTGSTDGKYVATENLRVAGIHPHIGLYLQPAVQRTTEPATEGYAEAIMRAVRWSARSGPFRDFPQFSATDRRTVDLR